MRKSKIRKPPPLYVQTYSRESSPRCSSVLSDCDADDEGFMSSGEYLPSSSKPSSLSIPPGPYCPRRPTLSEVLSNVAPPPWTLSAFMAYLSQNHCLETLEFTMDATRYKNHYHAAYGRDPYSPLCPTDQDCEYVRMLWQKLMGAYIVPNGPREVNLPSDVRDRLLRLPNLHTAPDPRELDQAVKIIYELMDESVLVSFLNSVAPSSRGSGSSPWASSESFADTAMAGSSDEQSLLPASSHTRKGSPPPSGDKVPHSHGLPSQRLSQHPHLSAALGRATSARLSTLMSGSPAASTGEPDSLTDDTDSPSSMELMTPPTTPPTSDTGFASDSPGTSPRHSREVSVGWKKMSAKLGFKKGRSTQGSAVSSRACSGSEDHSVDGRMENFIITSTLTKKASPPCIDTTLKATEGASPLMVAHPGSPVDISGCRPSLVTAMASTHVNSDEKEFSFGSSRSHKLFKFRGNVEEGRIMSRGIGEDDVAAKMGSFNNEKENAKGKMMQVAGLPFYIPAKVPEQDERERSSETEITNAEARADFDFEEDHGTWISAHSDAHASRASLATTASSAGTIMRDPSPDDALSADISVACSSASSIYSCSTASMDSCTSSTGTDIYGWEEELDRKSRKGSPSWDHRSELGAAMRRLPSGGRTMGPRAGYASGVQHFACKRADGKKKSLLYRVLNISSTKRLNDETPAAPSSPSSSYHTQNDPVEDAVHVAP
ncbi:hypothetical protein DSL72_001131 [Monilinia vaccinii-corymbosi]|uniref:RGS domain-containing protein n=1 Tax=Monilinia vaccinii-corymbosi TaxID=61207 RepID=A0A8A3P5I1_9HELO|nr:hypothetical protein DSL72_001131 [Monilinia vaccinii-corymbosi]